MEMAEKEQDPEQIGFYTGSSRRVKEETFKTFWKTGTEFYLIDPPSDLDLRVMY
jgi:hypothetical protein